VAGGATTGATMQLTVIDGLTGQMLYTEESLGRVVGVLRAGSEEEAVNPPMRRSMVYRPPYSGATLLAH
jgi:acyl-CoA reductase-like NAD-dependent aldehyde dehydrogenase